MRVSRDGQLVQEVKDVISVIAKHQLVLATGHVSPDEGLMLVREGKRQGVKHMVVTHAMMQPVLMNVRRCRRRRKKALYRVRAGSIAGPGRRECRRLRGRH